MVKEEMLVKSEKVEVRVDKDNSLNYETKKWPYQLTLPLMWILTIWVIFKKKILRIKPKINTFWFDGLSRPCRDIKENAGSWRALDIIYNFHFGQHRISDYWIGMINAQAVRNRLRLVRRELIKAMRVQAQKEGEKEIRLLSIASGSAQAVIEAIAEVKKEGIRVQATLLDLDPTALDYSRKLAKKYSLTDTDIAFVRGTTRNLEEAMKGKRPHIVEMIGFLDYRPYTKAVDLIRRIYHLLMPGGKLLTANICPNFEKYFMKWVINWSMIYREPRELGEILVAGGFNPKDLQIICEPLQLHAVAICKRA